MSTPFYDLASLVLVPSGYKTSKVYAQKPLTTDGQLAFTRASTATRVAENGLIEKVRTNLLPQSNTFSNASWTKTSITIASGQADPEGGTAASKITENTTAVGATADIFQDLTATAGTLSFYAKAAEVTQVLVFFGGLIDGVYWNLSNGTFISYFGSGSSFTRINSTNLGGGWYRYEIATNASTTRISFFTSALNNFIHDTVNGNGFFLYETQYEFGDIATPYIPTTTAAVSVGMLANVPRLDYLGGGCPKLLLEPQRTNVALFSEQFNNAAYSSLTAGSATAPIVTANFATSPDGFQNADRLQFSRTGTASGDLSLLLQGAIPLSATGTATIYLKSNTSSTQNVLLYWGGGQGIVFAVTPDWQRFTLTNLVAGTDTILIGTRGGSGDFFNGGGLTLDVLAYGLQIEAASYATSYIPTLGAAVTRSADAASKTGISALIGQTEGTIFVDFVMSNNSTDMVPFDIAGSDGKLIWIRNAGAQFYGNGTTLIANIAIGAGTQGTRYKVAFVYGQNDFRLYRNGSLIGTDTSGTFTGTFSDISLNAVINQANLFNQVLIFKTKLTNAQLAELTTI